MIEESICEETAARTRIEESARGSLPLIFAATIFLSACLLFQVELIISKYLLPWFGGAAAVWTTSMLVFQVLLFGGYAYAHALVSKFGTRWQAKLQAVLVCASVLQLALATIGWPSPITPSSAWRPRTPEHPIIHVILVLLTSIGIPFFVLSSAGPLLQKWYARTTTKSPYRLYAVSNLGSLVGLFAYPVLVEPFLRVRTQAWIWSALYLLFAVSILVCARWTPVFERHGTQGVIDSPTDQPATVHYLMWLLFAACASAAMLAVTNEISEKIAPLPMVWVLPLGIYLISFILCFGKSTSYRRSLFHGLFATSALISLLAPYVENAKLSLANLLVLLLAICMICHGELVKLKPSPKYLTSFYLTVSAGGAVGGILVAVVAPTLFTGVWEFPTVLWGTVVLITAVLLLDKSSWLFGWSRRAIVFCVAIAALAPLMLSQVASPQARSALDRVLVDLKYFQVAILLFLPGLLAAVVFRRNSGVAHASRFRPVQMTAAAAVLLFGYTYVQVWRQTSKETVVQTRNFYGTLSVIQFPAKYVLVHGQTIHGEQGRSPATRHNPTAYYATSSGVGQLLNYHPKRATGIPMRIGIVGLGAGTIAAYGQRGDRIRFYEIDPGVVDLVKGPQAWFSYLADSSAHVDVVLGDARLTLQNEADQGELQQFDVLVLDAFSGDAIPVHLLTREAIELYLRHLSGPEAVLAVHISSAMLDMQPVLAGIAHQFHLEARLVVTEEPTHSVWVLLSRDPASVSTPGLLDYGRPLSKRAVLWTDDFSNLLQVLR